MLKPTPHQRSPGCRPEVTRRVEVKLYDAQGALQLLGKGYRLFVERVDVEERPKKKLYMIEEFQEAARFVKDWQKRRWPDLADHEIVDRMASSEVVGR